MPELKIPYAKYGDETVLPDDAKAHVSRSGDYLAPCCLERVSWVNSTKKVKYFRHYVDATGVGSCGESIEHMESKLKLVELLNLCLTNPNGEFKLILDCPACVLDHEIPLNIYGKPYEIRTEYFYQLPGQKAFGDVVLIKPGSDKSMDEVIYWFEVFNTSLSDEMKLGLLDVEEIDWVEVKVSDVKRSNVGAKINLSPLNASESFKHQIIGICAEIEKQRKLDEKKQDDLEWKQLRDRQVQEELEKIEYKKQEEIRKEAERIWKDSSPEQINLLVKEEINKKIKIKAEEKIDEEKLAIRERQRISQLLQRKKPQIQKLFRLGYKQGLSQTNFIRQYSKYEGHIKLDIDEAIINKIKTNINNPNIAMTYEFKNFKGHTSYGKYSRGLANTIGWNIAYEFVKLEKESFKPVIDFENSKSFVFLNDIYAKISKI